MEIGYAEYRRVGFVVVHDYRAMLPYSRTELGKEYTRRH